jgi:hypothetical protein
MVAFSVDHDCFAVAIVAFAWTMVAEALDHGGLLARARLGLSSGRARARLGFGSGEPRARLGHGSGKAQACLGQGSG